MRCTHDLRPAVLAYAALLPFTIALVTLVRLLRWPNTVTFATCFTTLCDPTMTLLVAVSMESVLPLMLTLVVLILPEKLTTLRTRLWEPDTFVEKIVLLSTL